MILLCCTLGVLLYYTPIYYTCTLILHTKSTMP